LNDPTYTFPWANSGAEPPQPSRAKDHRSAPVISSNEKTYPFDDPVGSSALTQTVPAATVTPPHGHRPFVGYVQTTPPAGRSGANTLPSRASPKTIPSA